MTRLAKMLRRLRILASRRGWTRDVFIRECPCGGDIWHRRDEKVVQCDGCKVFFTDNVAFVSKPQLHNIWQAELSKGHHSL